MESLPLEVFKESLDVALSAMVLLTRCVRLDLMISKMFFNLVDSVVLYLLTDQLAKIILCFIILLQNIEIFL